MAKEKLPRITTGSAKNKKIRVPDVPGIRVVQDVYKLAVFSIIGQENVEGKQVLDLYAGSGSLGIEALSRGAEWCDFVDKHKKAVEAINENLQNCGLAEKAEVFDDDSIKHAANTIKRYDIIFVDPFYDELKLKFLFENLEEILNEGGVIVYSHGEASNVEDQISNTKLKIVTQRRFGKSHMAVLSH